MNNELFDELARWISVADGRRILRSIGFPPAEIPQNSGTSGQFWSDVLTQIEGGRLVDGQARLVGALVREWPDNRVFRAAAELPGLTAGGSVAAERPPLRVLFLFADPAGPGQDRLRLGAEARLIQETARQPGPQSIEVAVQPAARPADILPALLRHRPEVLHLGGHGSPNGYFMLEQDDGGVGAMSSVLLAGIVETVGGIRTVVMTACHLGAVTTPLPAEVESVIACRNRLPDPAALSFDRGFYTGLRHARTVGDSFRLGLHQVDLDSTGPVELELRTGGRSG
ncbi:effector-associated domain EAD1-containing protein [Kitasatospora sp. NPDC056651]|uniref:effector-associated domain EAD1-containing protein n=1 Tax=Kitasatospora sp. NPDC056651 TaxID=3345892 RepID=UPI0036737361